MGATHRHPDDKRFQRLALGTAEDETDMVPWKIVIMLKVNTRHNLYVKEEEIMNFPRPAEEQGVDYEEDIVRWHMSLLLSSHSPLISGSIVLALCLLYCPLPSSHVSPLNKLTERRKDKNEMRCCCWRPFITLGTNGTRRSEEKDNKLGFHSRLYLH